MGKRSKGVIVDPDKADDIPWTLRIVDFVKRIVAYGL